MEHISLTHAQYTKAIRIVSVYLRVAAYKQNTQNNKVYFKICVVYIFFIYLPKYCNLSEDIQQS